MNARISVVAISFWLALASLVVGCSKKEEAPATTAVDSAAPPGDSSSPSSDSEDEELGTGDAVALAETYAKQCGSDASSDDCQILRSLLVVEVTAALQDIERARDNRGSEEALVALDLTDEPEILVAACRVLGQFPDTPGIPEKALPLVLGSPYIEVQQAAANLIARNSDNKIADIGRVWSQNHSSLGFQNEFQEYPDFPAHYAAMKFPSYPGAHWFSPGDSQQSIGWSTPDDAATVAAWMGKALNSESLTMQQWFERKSAAAAQTFQSLDQSKVAQVAKLTEQYSKTLDPKLIEQVEKLQKELYAPMEAATKIDDQSMDNVAMPGNSSPQEDVHYFIAEEKAGHIARAVLVYRLPGINETVVQTSWNLSDYPSAWPGDGTGS
jgi:hypothetical protein